MSSRKTLRAFLKLDRILPFPLLVAFFVFFAHFLRRNPGEFLTAWVTFAVIAMATEDVFTGVGDRFREWRRRIGVSTDDLARCASEGEAKFQELHAAALGGERAWERAHETVEDIRMLCDKMRPGIDRRLTTRSNLWNIVVYGLSAAVSFSVLDTWRDGWFYTWPWYLRGVLFTAIFFWEFTWGWAIEKLTGICPWRYERSLVRWKRYIKPGYVGLWISFGFVLEWTHLHLVPLIVSTFTVLPHH